ncbi:hypothetical protein FQA39_LY12533 [Lamprigera yunnana]|nr:hypothetical protein FQA39_LY12533 [Lamprigera yunnana]
MLNISRLFKVSSRKYLIEKCFCHSINPEITKNSIVQHLRTKLQIGGPISIADYMKEILTSPLGGYYMHRDVFGAEGDFVTSPEVSQVFGELIAIWFLNEWSKAGSPKPIQIVELGPGRGTLCHDILRVFARFKLLDYATVHLVEVSPHLTKLQAETLRVSLNQNDDCGDNFYVQKGNSTYGVPVFWYRHLDSVPKNFTIFIAHEFFDALPVHQFKKTNNGYREVLIDIDPHKPTHFRYVLAPTETPIGKLFIGLKETRSYVEISPETLSLTNKIAHRLERYGGLALIVDYGHNGDGTDSFRAFKNHKLHDPLIEPGSADLTADVDFAAIKKAAIQNNEVLVTGPILQCEFLRNMGIDFRLEKLKTQATSGQKESLDFGYKMLMDRDKMGERFKFLAVVPATLSLILNKYPLCGFN